MGSWEIRNQMRRRVAQEEGVLRKGAALNVALCHPAAYPVAMSSLGFQAIYREVHAHPDAAAERAFLPDDPGEHRRSRTPVFTYENERPLADFPVLAFSVAYELEITGVFEMLDLCGIPALRAERESGRARHPFILAGGPQTASNPAILLPFVDALVVGEGEDVLRQVLDILVGAERRDWRALLARVPGCHVPGVTTDAPAPVRAPDGRLPACSQIVTADTVLSSMFLVEAGRGCSRRCAYCVMRGPRCGGMRAVPMEEVLRRIPAGARRVGLVGAAVTDHPQIREIVREVVSGGGAAGREIGLSSLRADRLDEELVRLLAAGGCRTLTTASDGASQRMRDLAGRDTGERHILRAAEFARDAGIGRMKLYEMIGFPGETLDDIDELVRFALELSKVVPLSLTVSPFVAKKGTPLGDAPFEAIPSLEAKLARTRSGLRGKVEVKPASVRAAWLEHMLSQGGESAGLAALDAWRGGGRFAAWRRAFAAIQGGDAPLAP
ncbi:MAG: B12-binding domain-containing radical SAM protein [Acidobacteriota bacterium]|jgi:radical SAM superfamily enzyme YgiQ (UPF0313 family)|nr:B12-binding domain-containing radical SAM protein [Acidobacteriota bacterium]